MAHTTATRNDTPAKQEASIRATYKAQQASDTAARNAAAERLMQLIAEKTGQAYTSAATLKQATSTTDVRA